MATLTFMEWNMEWLNDLFVSDSQQAAFRPDAEVTEHDKTATVGQRKNDIIGVLSDLQPDVLVLEEGPSKQAELDLLFQQVNGQWATCLQPGQTQNIGLAVRTDTGKFGNPAFVQHDTSQMQAFGSFPIDLDDDGILEEYRFERRPLYATVNLASGKSFQVLGLHLKSKGIFTAYEWSKWWQVADANRRKILAQATQLRAKFLDDFLSNPNTSATPLIVCGDINDGPGLDASEKRLFGSGIERLMGTVWNPDTCLRNALFDSLSSNERDKLDFSNIATASFQDPIFNNTWQRDWIDHILFTDNQPIDNAHPLWVSKANVRETMPDGQKIWAKYKHASDHFPVTAEINL